MLSFEQLIQNLIDTTQPSIVRIGAIARLVSQGNSHGIKCLIEVLTDSDSMVRREAAKALQQLNATRAAEPLLRAVQVESNDLTLWTMLEVVGELATPEALPMLESLKTDASMLTRIEVKKSIARIQSRYTDEDTFNHPEISVPERRDELPQLEEMGEDDGVIEESAVAFENLSDDSEEVIDPTHYTQFTEEADPITEITDVTDAEQLGYEAVESIDENDTTIDTETAQLEKEAKEIEDLAGVIAQSSRLAGSSVDLPVLVPNAATVPYDPNGTALEPPRTNFFLTLMHPGRYFSKQWMQRTRVYLLLWAALLIVTVGFTVYQQHQYKRVKSVISHGAVR